MAKAFVILLFVAVAGGRTSGYNVGYHEGDRYASMPDGNGQMRVVDLQMSPEKITQEQARYSPANDNIYFLYTRQNPTNGQRLVINNGSSLTSSNFFASRPTKVIMHGWTNHGDSPVNILIRDAFLAAADVNVIVVDWAVGAGADYIVAVQNVVHSGEHVADVVDWLISTSGASVSQFHFVGHSLGGHHAGVAARNVRSGRIPYLTALDPALPEWTTNSNRVTANDAVYVEVMHTNAGHYGFTDPTGHVDFYPNGGTNMPGCTEGTFCSHELAVEYFAESLTNDNFVGRRCASYKAAANGYCVGSILKMGGLHAKTGFSGIYYLTTNANFPFAQGWNLKTKKPFSITV